MNRQELIEGLKAQLQQFERISRASSKEIVISTGQSLLDQSPPGEGLAAGTLLEWLSPNEGSGVPA